MNKKVIGFFILLLPIFLKGQGKSFFNYSKDSVNSYYKKGIRDADEYYDRKGNASEIVTAYVSFIPIAGLVPAIACSSAPPKDKNLHIPQTPMVDDTNYLKGYRHEAYRIKKHNIWRNFFIATACDCVAFLLLYFQN